MMSVIGMTPLPHPLRSLYLSRCFSELSLSFQEAAEWLVELAWALSSDPSLTQPPPAGPSNRTQSPSHGSDPEREADASEEDCCLLRRARRTALAARKLVSAAFWSGPELASYCLKRIFPGGGGRGSEQSVTGSGGGPKAGGSGGDSEICWAVLEAVMLDASRLMEARLIGERAQRGVEASAEGDGGIESGGGAYVLEVLLEKARVSCFRGGM